MRTVATMAMLLLAVGCSGRNDPPTRPPPPAVVVVTVERRTIPLSYEFPGQVEAFRRVDVRARVEGIIVARPFKEGAQVRPGQLLYQLDTIRYAAVYRSAVARLQNARTTYERLQPLLARHAVSQQDVDNARADYLAAQASVEEAKKDLEDTRVVAEISGQVGRTRIDVGGRVTGPADLLTTIDQLDSVHVSFEPSAEQVLEWRANPRSRALIQPGSDLAVRVVLPDSALMPGAGTLDFVAPAVDPVTGTVEFRATFHSLDQRLTPGAFVRVRLLGFTRDSALAVPQKAVQMELGQQYVYLVGPGDTATIRDVQTGRWSDSLWIINSGLAPGDRVVVEGVQKTRPGQPVRPVSQADTGSTGSRLGP